MSIANVKDFYTRCSSLENEMLIIKFGADWCAPCNAIKNVVQQELDKSEKNIIFIDLDIDENIEIYGHFKTKRLVSGIPAMLAFVKPDEDIMERLSPALISDSVSGANQVKIRDFFGRCNKKAKSINNNISYL